MDQQRLFMAIAISLAILLGFEYLVAPHLPHPEPAKQQTALNGSPASQPQSATAPQTSSAGAPGVAAAAAPQTVPKQVPRVQINAPSLRGSISLLGARLDDLVLTHYRETLDKNSPDVRLLEPESDKQPYYVQYGWTAAPNQAVKVPGNDTVWTASADTLTAEHPVTLSWNNGGGLTFELRMSVGAHYMFSVSQVVKNGTGQPVQLFPWKRIRRDYEPEVAGYYILFEGLLGVVDGTLQETTYAKTKSEGKTRNGIAYEATSPGGWAGITDKYWLTALVPDQSVPEKVAFRHIELNGDHYQVDYITKDPETIAPGAEASLPSHLFT